MTTHRRTVLKDKATGLVGMGDMILEYDEYENFESWKNNETELSGDNAAYLEYCESGYLNEDMNDFIETLSEECEKRGFFDQLTYTDARNINWQHMSGSRTHRFSDVEEVVRSITPSSGEWTMRVYEYYNGLAFVVIHHDCPTGSKYYITPVEDSSCPKCDTIYEFDKEHAFIKKWGVCPECAKEDAWIMINGSPGPAQDYLVPFDRYKSRDLLVDYLYATQSLDAEEEEMAEFGQDMEPAEEFEMFMSLARDADKIAKTGWFEVDK